HRGRREGRTMNRRAFVTGLGTVFAAPLAAEAQQARGLSRVAVLWAGGSIEYISGPDPASPGVRAFVRALRDLGYVEGQNVVIERRSLEGRWERAPELFADLIRLKVRVIAVEVTSLAQEALRAGVSIPIVVVGSQLVEEGLVASLARPGGTVTGLDVWPTPELFPKGLELLKEAVPRLSRVGG